MSSRAAVGPARGDRKVLTFGSSGGLRGVAKRSRAGSRRLGLPAVTGPPKVKVSSGREGTLAGAAWAAWGRGNSRPVVGLTPGRQSRTSC